LTAFAPVNQQVGMHQIANFTGYRIYPILDYWIMDPPDTGCDSYRVCTYLNIALYMVFLPLTVIKQPMLIRLDE
jgi:hypothetical protein